MITLDIFHLLEDRLKVILFFTAVFFAGCLNANENISYSVKMSSNVPEGHTVLEPEASHLLYGVMNETEYLINFPNNPMSSAKAIKFVGDLDLDGMPEAIIATWPGGNCCGPRYYVVSPKEEGFFSVQTHEDMQGFSTLGVVYKDGGPIIKLLVNVA